MAVLFLSVGYLRQRKLLLRLDLSLAECQRSERILRSMKDPTPDLMLAMDRQQAELKHVGEDLRSKDRLLATLATGTLELIRADSLEAAARGVIKLLGVRMELERVSIYCNKTADGAVVLIDQLAAWDRSSDEVEYRSTSMQQIPAAAMPFVTTVLSKDEIYCGSAGELEDEGLQTLLVGRAMRSLASVPIFAGGRFWGFMTLNDYSKRRQWTEAEFSVLRCFSATLGAVIQKKEMESALLICTEQTRA